MIKYYNKHKSERFEFIAFHDARAKTLEQMDAELAKRKTAEQYWNGKSIPFPILLDATGATIKKFKVRAFPTHILIDPQGRLVKTLTRRNMFTDLESAIRSETKQEPAVVK